MTHCATKIKLRPLGDRLIVQKVTPPSTKGGIILPDNSEQKKDIAIVIAIGSGHPSNNNKMPVSIGDKIGMDNYSGQSISIEDEEYVVLRIADVIAKIED